MKRSISAVLFLAFLLNFNLSFADKPYNEWGRSDVMAYFETNNIIYEGEYKNAKSNQYIIIGRLDSKIENINMNFFLEEGKLAKALLTTPNNNTFQSLQQWIEEQGFEKVTESNDQLGNQYKRYLSGVVELTVVNKKADWPEVYFQP